MGAWRTRPGRAPRPPRPGGAASPGEERSAEEITRWGDRLIAAEGIRVRNPAFDITPHHLITAIVTDAGVAAPPYTRSLEQLIASRVGGGGGRDRRGIPPRRGTSPRRWSPSACRGAAGGSCPTPPAAAAASRCS